MAALDQAVNERNVLSAQNTQLWKLIEKQRSGYNQILKELDRIRAERDSYRAKVIAFGGSVEKKSHKGTDRATRPNADASDASPNPRHQVSRHHSDDNGALLPSFVLSNLTSFSFSYSKVATTPLAFITLV